MQTLFDTLKNVILNMTAIGWEPYPLIATVCVMIGGRLFFEEDIVKINDVESKREQMSVKRWVALASYVLSVVACYAFDFPKTKEEHLQAFIFSIMNVIVGYAAYSAYQTIDVKGRLKNFVTSKIGGSDVPSNSGDPSKP
jgi:hypothetical protein